MRVSIPILSRAINHSQIAINNQKSMANAPHCYLAIWNRAHNLQKRITTFKDNVHVHTVELDITAGIMFGGLLEKGRKLQLVDVNLAATGS